MNTITDLEKKVAGKEVELNTLKQNMEIAKTKLPDLNCYDIEAAKAIIAGTARSMGVAIGD